jgi:hypothetical protein
MPKVRKPKKGKKYLILSVVMALILAFTGLASAEMVICDPQSDLNSGQFCKDGYSGSASWVNSQHYEGATSDTNETHVYAIDPTSDNVQWIPDESGTYMVTTDSFSISGASDAQILVFNATDGWAPDSHTLTGDVTGTMANTGAVATTLSVNTVDSAEIVANAVGASELYYEIIVANVPQGSTTTTETVTSGSIVIGGLPLANVVAAIINSATISSTTLTVTLGSACDASASTDCVYNITVLRP